MFSKIIRQDNKRVYFESTLYTMPEDLMTAIEKEQEKLGYHPLGYGSPMAVSVEVVPTGGYLVYWKCAASCD